MSRRMAVAAFAALALLACGDDAETPSDESLSGLWTATSWEYVNVENRSQRVDLIDAGGTAEININDTGGYFAQTQLPGEPVESFTGSWDYTSDTFTLFDDTGTTSWVFDLDLGNDRMTLSGADAEYDFDGDGIGEPAEWNMELERD
ncbi:MAG: hypothetical protein MUC69_11345 [Gemmatimonadales bacterium]|nr:hypothetical protein [Gemmatimonadales bacterium]